MLRIGPHNIGWDENPFIIAEIGVNHDGNPAQALALVEAAARAGASAVKFQYFEARRLLSGASRLADYQRHSGETEPQHMLRRLELSLDALASASALARDRGLAAIVTVFSTELVRSAQTLEWDAYKAASPDIVNHPLLRAMHATSRPLIVSTGAATAEEIGCALTDYGHAALHCVSAYPTPEGQAQLGGIDALSRLIDRMGRSSIEVGYSDHTGAVDTGALAVAAGACILEKHLTYDRSASGPDHAASVDESEFAQYVRLAQRARRMRGEREVVVQAIEENVRTVSRQSLVAVHDLPAGRVIRAEDLTIKRPGTGIGPKHLGVVIGRRMARNVGADQPISWKDLAA